MYCELLELIDDSFVTLTANQRLTHHLNKQFTHYQSKSKYKKVWCSPRILPLNTWLAHCWQRHCLVRGRLLSNFEVQWCWQRIITTSTDNQSYLAPQTVASLAKEAWDNLVLWNLKMTDLAITNQEVATFVHWGKQFEYTMRKNNWLCSAQLPQEILQLANAGHLKLPPRIAFVGFDDYPPAIKQLIAQLKRQSEIIEHTPTNKHAVIQRIHLLDQEQELFTQARWAKQQYQHDPSQRIGCIIPNLTALRQTVEHIFNEVFIPTNHLPGSKNISPPFNLSLGEHLSSFAVVQTALNALAVEPHAVDFSQLSTLMRCKYINTNIDDICSAMQLEKEIRESNQLQIDLISLMPRLAVLQTDFPNATFPARLKTFLLCRQQTQQQRQTPSQWASVFNQELTHIGWTENNQLTSREYQIKQRFYEIVAELSTLDNLATMLSCRQALDILKQLTAQTIFQPQNTAAPVQILGALEASGIEFDQLWISGLHDENWPPRAKPNPFLPSALQQHLGMPHASAQRELEYTQRLQRRLFNSADKIYLSVATHERDNILLPSRLIRHIPIITLNSLNLANYESLITQVFNSKQLETIVDTNGPSLTATEKIHGGSKILQQQALCPFQAFASIRLHAKALPEPQLGLNAAERGTLVHRTLEQVWKIIKSQQQLNSYSQTTLKKIIVRSIAAITKYYPAHQSLFLTVEKKRITTLLLQWLNFEKTRPIFQVDQRESTRNVKIGDLALQLKIDRIDTLSDGSKLIIDYKTGCNNPIHAWFGKRPHAIQLPLYAAYGSPRTVGIAYAQVCTERMTFKGISAQHDHAAKHFSDITPINKLPGAATHFNWEALLKNWRDVLAALSLDFCSGHAAVDPIDVITACTYCDLQALCRIGSRYEK